MSGPLGGRPFLTGGRIQRVVEAGNEAAHPARLVQAAHLARDLHPPAAPQHRPHLRAVFHRYNSCTSLDLVHV